MLDFSDVNFRIEFLLGGILAGTPQSHAHRIYRGGDSALCQNPLQSMEIRLHASPCHNPSCQKGFDMMETSLHASPCHNPSCQKGFDMMGCDRRKHGGKFSCSCQNPFDREKHGNNIIIGCLRKVCLPQVENDYRVYRIIVGCR